MYDASSTFTGTGPPGFSLVAPVVVTSQTIPYSSSNNVRGLALLRIDFKDGRFKAPFSCRVRVEAS